MPSPLAAYNAAREMVNAGEYYHERHTVPNVKLALAAGILSANNRLDRNGWQVHSLREYMQLHNGRFPADIETLKAITSLAGYTASRQHCVYLLELQAAEDDGQLAPLSHKPQTANEWLLWRQAARTLRGLGWKTASFAALLMWPFDCPLVPVDRHVIARLAFAGKLQRFNIPPEKLQSRLRNDASGYRLYRAIERIVGNEKLRSSDVNARHVSTAIWHWAQWSTWRQFVGQEPKGSCESHANLSAYWY